MRLDLIHRSFGKDLALSSTVILLASRRTKSMSCSMTMSVWRPFKLQQQLGSQFGLLVGQAGGRLVHQKELGVGDDQHADFQPLPLAMAEIFRRRVGVADQVDAVQDLENDRRAARRSRGPAGSARRCAGPEGPVPYSRYTRQAVETVGVWNFRPTPSRAISDIREVGDIDVVEVDSSRWRRDVLPLMTSHKVVLPAPLGPMTTRSSLRSTEKRVDVQGLEAVERDGHVLERNQWITETTGELSAVACIQAFPPTMAGVATPPTATAKPRARRPVFRLSIVSKIPTEPSTTTRSTYFTGTP